ncbi:hypothetical protein CABS01_17055 [Colletotrichum abscissum]|uniref:uncharacterized protein n=1 Tax=Colletotrichum abscissum TaxID=1671311 RepID=UPI0027D4975C|nr:uncharacterized protein CABS01_17055 [Colletotrichum abscissum]KAK1496685.1 hypothetical protein CABS01_17055 [Colletotrichum abscissum]
MSMHHRPQTPDHRPQTTDTQSIDMVSATRTTALSSNGNHHDDVICLGSMPSTWSASASITIALPRAAASTRTRTSPLGQDSNDEVTFLLSRPVPTGRFTRLWYAEVG